MSFEHQPAYILHSRPYRDTSLLLELFTREYGRVTVIARGVKRGKRNINGILQPGIRLLISAKGRGDILTMTAVEPESMPLQLIGQRQIAAFYINELMIRLLGKFESVEKLFDKYHHTLLVLQTDHIETVLRCFEKKLIEELGYGLSFDVTYPDTKQILSSAHYAFVQHGGFIESPQNKQTFSGNVLLKIAKNDYSCAESLQAAKKIFRHVLQFYLGKKPLMSRELWQTKVEIDE